jgi:hypothetical protein
MTPERWRQVEGICHAARDRGSEERAAFLAEACGSDAELIREVEALLAEGGSRAGQPTDTVQPGADIPILVQAKADYARLSRAP